ncbi:ribonuclease III [Persicobacter psychrovividus]|uniref:Ribonuclease 3 n=1 Tax=Persicobacter psychrovividus TaxID=387638 RepID=A0ABN6L8R4_9BACT|nr:hypothetical protein PEPS_18780 [Persicobacter psychrovividus]
MSSITQIVGIKPLNLYLYRLVTQHTSVAKETKHGTKESYERLEYLGDAVLGTIVAEFLFKKYPFKNEGFLTEIRSRMVNRETLNQIAVKIGLNNLVEYNQGNKHGLAFKSIYGDALEALVGAVYLDHGYRRCHKFVIKKLLIPHYDLEKVILTNPNHKSQLIEWAHQHKKEVRFEVEEVKNNKHFKEFAAQVFIDDAPIGRGTGLSKKKAEQNAAEKSMEKVNKK